MVGLLKEKIAVTESMLAATIEQATPASAPASDDRRETYYCNEQGCWVAEQYFCDETGCWIIGDDPVGNVDQAVEAPKKAKAKSGKPEKVVVQQGIFAPAVKLTAQVMGRKELNAFRASVIAKHT